MTTLSTPPAPPAPPATDATPRPVTVRTGDLRPALQLGLRADITVTPAGPILQVGGARTGQLPVKQSVAAHTVLATLAGAPVAETELAGHVVAAAGETGLFEMHMLLARLAAAGFVEHRLTLADDVLARLRVVGQGASKLGPTVAAGTAVRLSRFARAGVEDGTFAVRSPRSGLAVDLHHRVAGLLGLLAEWHTPDELERHGVVPDGALAPLLRLFACAGLLADGAPRDERETPSSSSGQWSAADLWLHAHSRSAATSAGYGGTYHGKGVRDPLPAGTGSRWESGVALEVPDLHLITERDPRFTDVLEARRSRRIHDDAAPITKTQLGELLYRSARLRRSFAGSDGEEVADRPYPSGGATHELEIYPLVTRCDGLDAGLYHYRTDAHRLELVTPPDKATAKLVARARASAVMPDDPQVVLLVSARFGRVMFKYETIAYSLILKHVGVLYQTIYLVGEAMGLAVCGLGGGDAEIFAGATGLDYLSEGSVGELVLGSTPPPGVHGDAENRWQGETSPS